MRWIVVFAVLLAEQSVLQGELIVAYVLSYPSEDLWAQSVLSREQSKTGKLTVLRRILL